MTIPRASTSKALFALYALLFAALVGTTGTDAQQPGKVYRVGVLFPQGWARFDEFRQALRDLGYVDGQNLILEPRFTGTDEFYRPDLANQLVDKHVDVIAAAEVAGGRAARDATSDIPIVVLSCDPHELLVNSIARPGGNVTGQSCMTSELTAKKLELFKQAIPSLSRIAFLYNPRQPGPILSLQLAQSASHDLGLTITPIPVTSSSDFLQAFEQIAGDRFDGLFVYPEFVTGAQRSRIIQFAREQKLPAMYGFREWADAGGLISYGTSAPALARRSAGYVDKILRGVKPADLPIEQPTKFDLVINLKTAKTLGITVPESLLARADEVIE